MKRVKLKTLLCKISFLAKQYTYCFTFDSHKAEDRLGIHICKLIHTFEINMKKGRFSCIAKRPN